VPVPGGFAPAQFGQDLDPVDFMNAPLAATSRSTCMRKNLSPSRMAAMPAITCRDCRFRRGSEERLPGRGVRQVRASAALPGLSQNGWWRSCENFVEEGQVDERCHAGFLEKAGVLSG
jgi:hypothetical protein